jgi:hypothetical protein
MLSYGYMRISGTYQTETGVGELNGDVIIAAGRHLAAKTASGSILNVRKTRITC